MMMVEKKLNVRITSFKWEKVLGRSRGSTGVFQLILGSAPDAWGVGYTTFHGSQGRRTQRP